jgi:hypothetical protein
MRSIRGGSKWLALNATENAWAAAAHMRQYLRAKVSHEMCVSGGCRLGGRT